MTQEDKELLLEDLSARVPFKVKLYIESLVNPIIHDKGIRTLATVLPTRGAIEYDIQGSNQGIIVELVKPILRPLSSMTKEEFDEFNEISPMPLGAGWDTVEKKYHFYKYVIADFGCCEELYLEDLIKIFNWFNSHHFDYRGLIEKGLAVSELDFRVYGRRG